MWARDSCVSLIGATAARGTAGRYKKVFCKSLETLASRQTRNGQIPNAVDFVGSIDAPATYATIDSSLWFVLGEYFYRKCFGLALWKKHAKNIGAAMKWVEFQDTGEDLLPEQQPTSDWMDCFPHKYGHTINTQALYYAALKATNGTEDKVNVGKFVKQVNCKLWDDSLGYYLPWHWKDHNEYSEKEFWFDSLGNMLAIAFGLASRKQARRILSFADEMEINRPYPLRAIYPPISRGSKPWKDYFDASLAGKEHSYINGGIWPYIGGFYVCALIEAGQGSKAQEELELLAKANSLGKKLSWDFNEWISPVTGTPEGGRHQVWSAGAYMLAHEAVESKRNPLAIG
ncbi:Alkaline and neutral invertase [uncultured archaeon]|nr:Alkaline and neutral invertase [uncultured archaeon]